MKLKKAVLATLAGCTALASIPALADNGWHRGHGWRQPHHAYYYGPRAVLVVPPPAVYYAPAPLYYPAPAYAPAPAYVPAPAYYAAPVYPAAPVVSIGLRFRL